MYNGIHQCAPFITLVLTLVITKAQASKEVQYVRHYVSEEIDAANMKIATDSIKDSAFLDECSWKAQINCVLVHPGKTSFSSCSNQCQCKRDRYRCECANMHNDYGCEQLGEIDIHQECLRKCKERFPNSDHSVSELNNDRIVASTTTGDNYLFFTPITSLLWRYVAGYVPLTFIIVPQAFLASYQNDTSTITPKEHHLIHFVIEKTQEVGGQIVLLEHSDQHGDAVVSQVSRLYAAMLNYSTGDATYLLACDIDMWPLQYDHFHQRDPDKKVQLFYANAYQHQKNEVMYPICYIGATVPVWKDIMKLRSGDVRQTILSQLDQATAEYGTEWNAPGYGVQWYYDQKLFGRRIAAWPGHPKDCQKINRPPDRQFLADRLDRGRWKFNSKADLQGMIDAHILRPGFSDENWPRLKVLLEALLTKEQVRWVEMYKQQFVNISRGK